VIQSRKVETVPMADVRQLWNENRGHNWEELQLIVKEYRDRIPEIDDDAIDRLISEIDYLKSRKEYPDSPEKLHRLLNERFP
jgi:hypothetical protein